MENKQCSKCNEIKPVSEFNKEGKKGLKSRCKQCHSAQTKMWSKSQSGKESAKKYQQSSKGKKAFKKCTTKYWKKISAIYKITDDNDDILYVGQSSSYNNRKNGHLSFIRNPHLSIKSKQSELYNALRQHSNVSINIIEECSPEVLLQREQYYIDNLKPLYNVKLS